MGGRHFQPGIFPGSGAEHAAASAANGPDPEILGTVAFDLDVDDDVAMADRMNARLLAE